MIPQSIFLGRTRAHCVANYTSLQPRPQCVRVCVCTWSAFLRTATFCQPDVRSDAKRKERTNWIFRDPISTHTHNFSLCARFCNCGRVPMMGQNQGCDCDYTFWTVLRKHELGTLLKSLIIEQYFLLKSASQSSHRITCFANRAQLTSLVHALNGATSFSCQSASQARAARAELTSTRLHYCWFFLYSQPRVDGNIMTPQS